MRLLMVHNEYARPSGEEHAAAAIATLLTRRGHQVAWYRKSSAALAGSLSGRIRAFFSGIYNPQTRTEISGLLDAGPVDFVQMQNLYPQLSSSIFKPCRDRDLPIVMRCPNYRLFCPTGLHLCREQLCERCAGGREWQCVMNNCTGQRLKSLGYAMRNAFARHFRMITGNVSLFIVLSEFQKRKFIANGIDPERIAVVPNFAASPPRPRDPGLGETISFVGRLSPEKGIGLFIEAARRLPQYSFAVAGDAEPMPGLAESAPPNVRFHGFLKDEALDEFYRRTRIFVYPGIWYEGFPNVVTRAMAAGKPVISSRIGAMPEIVTENETGVLFEPGNVEGLSEQIQKLFSDPQRCEALGRAGRVKVQREYTAEVVYRRLMDAYAQAKQLHRPSYESPGRQIAIEQLDADIKSLPKAA